MQIRSQQYFPSCLLLVCSLLFVATPLANPSASNLLTFDKQEQGDRYYQLLDEIRCPKCQNQNLADSDAQIAYDLRNELYSLVQQDLSDDEIYRFMSARYGNFVLYDPPLNAVTAILWLLPLGLFALSILVIALRHRFTEPAEGHSDAD